LQDRTGLRAELERIAAAEGIAGRIHWPGMLQGAAKWGAFKGAMAFILPSHQENFGIVVAEAMACNTPVLISNKVNIWREVETSGGGLVEPDTQDGALALFERFLALSDEERAAMGRKARLGYESHFSIEGAARDLLAVLEEVSRA
jgi:glycosyltransferase involved in cell wall biosynthesis